MARILPFATFLLIVIICLACSSNTQTGSKSSTPDRTAAQTAYEITIGSGGGVTGNVTGINIDTDGKVTEWSALANQEAKPEYLGTMPEAQLQKIYTVIEEDSLMNFDYVGTGNMTSFLTLKGGGDIHRIRWAGIETDTTSAPIPLRRFIDTMNKSYKIIEKP